MTPTTSTLEDELDKQIHQNEVLTIVLAGVGLGNALLIAGIVGALSGIGPALLTALAIGLWTAIAYGIFNATVLRATRSRPLHSAEDRRIRPLVSRFARRLSMPEPQLRVVDDAAANAFAVGTGSRATVVYTTGLLDLLDDEELEGVTAHELSHIANGDTRIALASAALLGWAVVVSSIVSILAVGVLFGGIGMLRHKPDEGDWTEVLTSICVGIILIIAAITAWLATQTWFLISLVTHLGIFRRREWLADATAVRITGKPLALARALEKAAAAGVELQHGGHLTRALSIFGRRSSSWWKSLFSTHPEIDQRIERLRNYAAFRR